MNTEIYLGLTFDKSTSAYNLAEVLFTFNRKLFLGLFMFIPNRSDNDAYHGNNCADEHIRKIGENKDICQRCHSVNGLRCFDIAGKRDGKKCQSRRKNAEPVALAEIIVFCNDNRSRKQDKRQQDPLEDQIKIG